jgi:hypothetical protein
MASFVARSERNSISRNAVWRVAPERSEAGMALASVTSNVSKPLVN